MSKQDFDTFINQVSEKKSQLDIDWNSIRDNWLRDLDRFYDKIEEFLKEYRDTGKLFYEFSEKLIFEEFLGHFPVKVMDIRLGEHRVKLEPIGINIIGADGRIDLIGANGKVKFVLVNEKHSSPPPIKFSIEIEGQPVAPESPINSPEDIKLAWKIATPPPRIKYKDLNQEIFLEALLEVIGG